MGINGGPEISRIFYGIYDKEVFLFPWVERVLDELHKKKHKFAVLTNRNRGIAGKFLEPIYKYFSKVVGAEDVKKLKPDPEGLNLILKTLEIPPSDALMIGDMSADIQAGKAAGTRTGAVSWGLGRPEDFLEKPDIFFENYKELLLL